MKRVVFLAGIALMSLVIEKAYAQQGIGTLHPDKSAALEMVSTKRGLLIPRIDIPDLTAPAPVTNPAHSLLVFNTGASGDRKSTRLNSSHVAISYAVFCLTNKRNTLKM